MTFSTLVIGIGNGYRSDDGVGLVVLRTLKARNFPGVECMECSGDGTALMESWKTADKVIIIDAAYSGQKPGTISRFDALLQPIPMSFSFSSTHTFGLAEALGMACTLNELPPSLVLYIIEGKNFTPGNLLSLEVEKAGRKVVEQVIEELRLP